MINGAALRINSKPPPPQNSYQHNSIQIPMLGSLAGPNKPPPGQQQQQQQPQAPQQQQGPQTSEIQQIPQSGQDFTLSNVLHYLQTEWRRYERDRNEWEIERAEMRARIALLEGERRSFDNVKLDLMRRIKMLEYALRVERSKQLAQPAAQSVPPAKLASLQSQIALSSQKDDASSGSSPRSEDSPLPPDRMSVGSVPNGAASGGPPSRTQTWVGQTAWSGVNPNAATVGTMGRPAVGRDPKSRARSRDFLKQCLQEVSYLTSPQAMNPLPNRPLLANPTIPPQLPNVPSFEQIGYNGRLKKTMPEVAKDFSTVNGMASGPSNAPGASNPQPGPFDRSGLAAPNMFGQPSGPSGLNQQGQQQQFQQQQPQQGQQPYQSESKDQEVPERPMADDAGSWKERFRLSQEGSEQARHQLNNNISGAGAWEGRTREEEDGKEEEEEEDDEDSSVMSEGESTKVWKAKRTLRNHLDAVRAIAFHPTELCLASAGDDNTVKIWRVDLASLTSPASRATTEVEPQLTLRGHSAAITCLVHSPSKGLLYSASMDSSIRVWALPPTSHTTYAPYDATRARGELIGHTDAVWDLALARDESTLISCGAEGLVKVWDVSGPSGGGSLKLSWSYEGLETSSDLSPEGDLPGASAVEAIRSDLKKVAVAYSNAVIKIFEIETGKELMKMQVEPVEGDDSISAQANSIVSHPTMPLLITGHEDKHIRIFDINTGQCTHSMLAHLDAVTSLSLDAAGFLLVSGSHDCSVRYWEILGSKACKQENTSHREKAREGVLDVEFHPSLPVMASAGADGVIKLYATTSAS
ncbi:WD40 repeat-like protein [Cubamyces sp. BRFM 1775]|nr:WD40 repeat-like protein [Cubamyces sp. BRFM 1775]